MSGLRRIRRGKGHSYTLDGESVKGVTTLLKNGVPIGGLPEWAAKEVAGYAINRWDELAELELSDRYERLRWAHREERDEAAGRGRDVHELAHRLAAGQDISVPDELLGHVDSYLRFAEEWRVEDLLVETPIGNRRRHYAGTLDLVARLHGDDGRVWLLDFKTSKRVYTDSALQLNAYAHAEFYVDQDGDEHTALPGYEPRENGAPLPLPGLDRAGVVWLRADGYDLIPVEIRPELFMTFLYAARVAEFVFDAKDNPEHYIGDALPPPRYLEEAS